MFDSLTILSDIHIPNHCPRALGAALAFIKDVKPSHIVLNGDVMDMVSVSSHGDANEALLTEELLAGNDFLDKLQSLVPKAKLHYNFGNHDIRLHKFVRQNVPSLVGALTLQDQLHLKQRGISWLEYGRVHFHGKLGITHGVFHGDHYTKQTLSKYGCSLVVGHAHRPQMYTAGRSGIDGHDDVRGVFGTGCLYPVDKVPYLHGPSGWVQGFFHAYVNRRHGHFTPYQILMHDSTFIWNGKVYGVPPKAKKK